MNGLLDQKENPELPLAMVWGQGGQGGDGIRGRSSLSLQQDPGFVLSALSKGHQGKKLLARQVPGKWLCFLCLGF